MCHPTSSTITSNQKWRKKFCHNGDFLGNEKQFFVLVKINKEKKETILNSDNHYQCDYETLTNSSQKMQ